MKKIIKILPLNYKLKASCGRGKRGNIILRFRRSSSHRARFFTRLDWRATLSKLYSVQLGFETLATQRNSFFTFNFFPTYSIFSASLSLTSDFVGFENKIKSSSGKLLVETLNFAKLGSFVCNVSHSQTGNVVYSRSAGTRCAVIRRLLIKGSEFVALTLPSGERKYFPGLCKTRIGTVSNPFVYLRTLNSAGASYHRFKRPRVRGVAMNPIDHPLGGGEGKSSGGRSSVSIWGWLTKGKCTVRNLGWYRRKKSLSRRFRGV